MEILTFRSQKNPDCPSAYGFRTVWIFLAPSGQNFHTGPAFGGKNVTDMIIVAGTAGTPKEPY